MTLPGVEYVAVKRLSVAPWNPREVRTERFEQLCRSLEADPEFLESRPILAQADGTVYAGNHRLLAARHLGWDVVPAIIADVPDLLAKQRAMVDNNNAADWADDELGALLAELQAGATDLSLLGFEDGELERLLDLAGGDGSGEVGEDPGPQLDRAAELQEKWGTARGDLWLIGRHRLLCGDSTSAEGVARLMGGERAALGLHDPPYGIAIVESGLADGKRHGNAVANRSHFAPIANDDRPFDPEHLIESADGVVLWGANHYADRLPSSAAWIVWDKRDGLSANGFSDAELAWVSNGGSVRIIRHMWNGMIRESERGQARVHPTQKPVEVQAEIIEKYTGPDGLVADWYLGSGTTMVAAEQPGRRCYGMEIEPKYVAVALERLAGMGLEPRRG